MDTTSSNNQQHHHHHDLPPFPSSAAGIILSPPQNNSHLPPILPQPPSCLGMGLISSPPQSYFYTNNIVNINNNNNIPLPPPPPPPAAAHFTPSFMSYGFPGGVGVGVGNNEGSNNINNNNNNCSVLLGKDIEGRRVLDAWSTKVARSKRRLARQRSLTLTRSSSSSDNHEYCNKPTVTTTTTTTNTNNATRTLFTFCTPDNKILRMLLKKELKNSDVGSLGRIVLPKREAEENLPLLTDKEGMQVVMRDVNSNRKWAMKYKYWANNRSRMYVLENTGDFVRQNGLVMGDSMTLYEDECKNLYVSVEKGENHQSRMEENYEMKKQVQCAITGGVVGYSSSSSSSANMEINIINKDEEEEASLALLIEELKHKAQDDDLQQHPPCTTNNNNNHHLIDNTYNNSSADSYFERGNSCSGYMSTRRASSSSYNMGPVSVGGNKEVGVEDLQQGGVGGGGIGFEDCFGGLDTLPEVSGFKFPLFDNYLNNDRT